MGQVLNLEFDLQPEVLPEAIEATTVPVTPRFPNIKISKLNQSFHTTECHISQKSQK